MEGDDCKLIRGKDLAVEHVVNRGLAEAKFLTECLNGEAGLMQSAMNDLLEVVGGLNREVGTVQADGAEMDLLTVDGVERVQRRQFVHGNAEG